MTGVQTCALPIYAQKPYNTHFKEAEFAEAAKNAALDMQQEINRALDQAGKRGAY